MKCTHCEADNPRENKFCGNCGRNLFSTFNNEQSTIAVLDETAENIIKEAVKKLENEIKPIKTNALEDFETKAISWAKRQMIFLSIALSILIMALGLFGYNKLQDIQKTVDTETKKIEEEKAKLDEIIIKAKDSINQANDESIKLYKEFKENIDELTALRKEMNAINPTKTLGQIRTMEKKVKASVAAARKIETTTKLNQEKVQKEIRKLRNSFMHLGVHFGGDSKGDEKLKWFIKTLNEKGFMVTDADVLRISVDEPEIIYYHETARPTAEYIMNILKTKFPDIKPQKLSSQDRTAKEMIIKLK